MVAKPTTPPWLAPRAELHPNGQAIHPQLSTERWLTEPADAEPGMTIQHADGTTTNITEVELVNGVAWITHGNDGEYTTERASEIKQCPEKVVV